MQINATLGLLLIDHTYFLSGNQCLVLFAILTSINITGTSVSTPTMVASAAGLSVPNKEIATATASSKKLEAPIIAAGAAISCGSFIALLARYAMKKIRKV